MGINTSNSGGPSVSIITVVYNSRNLIEKTIQSIINQDYRNKEYLIIDGGSTDGTLEIIKKYSSSIDFWKSEPDKGIYDAMNKGLAAAKGDYVIFMNSGDQLEENVLFAIFSSGTEGADIYYGETNLMDENGTLLGTRSQLTTRKLPERMTWKDMKYGSVVSHQSIFVKRSLAATYNLEYKCSADIDWLIQCLKRSTSIINTNRAISRYLIGGFSIQNRKRCLSERFRIYRKAYGLPLTIYGHMVLFYKNLIHKMAGKTNY